MATSTSIDFEVQNSYSISTNNEYSVMRSIGQHQRLAQLCKALGHPARLEIVRILGVRQNCFTGTISSQLPLAASTVSEHLKILLQAGIIQGQVDGPRRCYCLDPGVIREWRQLVGQVAGGT